MKCVPGSLAGKTCRSQGHIADDANAPVHPSCPVRLRDVLAVALSRRWVTLMLLLCLTVPGSRAWSGIGSLSVGFGGAADVDAVRTAAFGGEARRGVGKPAAQLAAGGRATQPAELSVVGHREPRVVRQVGESTGETFFGRVGRTLTDEIAGCPFQMAQAVRFADEAAVHAEAYSAHADARGVAARAAAIGRLSLLVMFEGESGCERADAVEADTAP